MRRRQSELQWVAELRGTLDGDGFLIYQQPIRAIARLDGAPLAFEVLLRQRGTKGEALTPGGSIAVAERYGVMAEVDRWVIRHAIEQCSRLCSGTAMSSINLSANSLDDESLADYIDSEVERSTISPRQLCFEITETAAISNLDSAVSFMRGIRARPPGADR